jgi:hypothetical protein
MISDTDFEIVAADLGCEVDVIKAVVAVESAGSGFLPDGRCKILFEAHIFSRLTDRRYDASRPHLSSRSWNKTLYLGGAAEYARLAEAQSLDREAALQATSWGAFQIMGFNCNAAGFTNVDDFVSAMQRDEVAQLRAFARFIKAKGLADELHDKRWSDLAAGYNGTGQTPVYAAKLAAAYANTHRNHAELHRHSMIELQTALNLRGSRLTIDGWPGPKTTAALQAFQASRGLKTTGVADLATRQALGLE